MCLQNTVERRTDMPEVAGVEDDLHPRVCCGQAAQYGDSPVGGGVVYVYMLEFISRQSRHHLDDLGVQVLNVPFFVKAGSHYADTLHATPVSSSRTMICLQTLLGVHPVIL